MLPEAVSPTDGVGVSFGAKAARGIKPWGSKYINNSYFGT